MRHSARLLMAATFLVALTACAGGMTTPTPTAIPLSATATPSPRPARATATATPAVPVPGPAPSSTTVAPGNSPERTQLDELLVRRTVEGFLDQLVYGESSQGLRLYLTLTAHTQWLEQGAGGLALPGRPPQAAEVLELRPAQEGQYVAIALLRWLQDTQQDGLTQTLKLSCVYQHGLWLIDSIETAEPEAQVATVAPTPTPRASRPTPPPAGRLVIQASSGGGIYVINSDGTGLRRLTDGLDPAWSPDGKLIAFTRWRDPWGVYLIRPDGSGEERIVDGPRLKHVTWSPDGSQLLVTINVSTGEPIQICLPNGMCFTLPPFSFGQMWLAKLDAGKKPLSDGYLSLPLDDRAVHAPTWDPASERIVYAGERGMAWIDLSSLEKGPVPGSDPRDTCPVFSPDGQKIAFMGRVHNHWDLFVVRSDGSGRRQLTASDPKLTHPPNNVAPAWSPDGKQLAFLSDRDGPWRIYVMNADGTGQRPLFGSKLDALGIRYEFAAERVISWAR